MKKFNFSKVILILVFTSLIAGCKSNKPKNADAEFNKISEDIISNELRWNPSWAVAQGFHEFDGQTSDLSQKSREDQLAHLKGFYEALANIDTAELSPQMYFDYRILRGYIRRSIFDFEEIKSYTKNPMAYATALDVSIYFKRSFAPIQERLKSVINIEKNASSMFSVARSNLDDSLPRPFIQLAIDIANGSANFLKDDIFKAVGSIKNDSLMSAFRESNDKAIAELKSFAQYLEKEKLPKANDNFALGAEKYSKMLLYDEDINISPEILLDMATRELVNEQKRFRSYAAIINPRKEPADVYFEMSKEHPDAPGLIPGIRKNVESIRDFLIKNKIVEVPAAADIKVEETPKFARSTSMASMDQPGPFEKKATESYYYITPVDSSWTQKQKEDWLAGFNRYTTDFVTIHEVYPGHFIQISRLNESNATKVEKLFYSYAFIEGWAHYAEKMMLDEGYGNNGDMIEAAKYGLAQTEESLLRLCRMCVSIKMHCQGMTVDEATKFFVENWYGGEKASRQEALRGTYDPSYLYYTLGKMMMLNLREDFKIQEGSNYSLEKFNNSVLEYGAPPFELLREKILKDRTDWKELF